MSGLLSPSWINSSRRCWLAISACPNSDGYDLIREVRARGHSYQSLPAIALTALAGPQDRRRALRAGYQVHVAKPADASELSATIAALIGRTDH